VLGVPPGASREQVDQEGVGERRGVANCWIH